MYPSPISIAAWGWAAIGVLGLARLAATLVNSIDDDAGPHVVVFRLVPLLGFSGLLTLCAAAIGWPVVSLYAWRVTAIYAAIVSTGMIAATLRRRGRGPPGAESSSLTKGSFWAAVIGLVVTLGFVFLSFQSQPPQVSTHSIPVVATEILKSTHRASYYFWTSTLVLLGVGTFILLVLFVQRLQRGGAPQIETHWGGIGGGLGGWRMSASLGYLIIATVLAVLFVVFFLQFDQRERDGSLDVHSGSQAPGPSNVEQKDKGLAHEAKKPNDVAKPSPSEH